MLHIECSIANQLYAIGLLRQIEFLPVFFSAFFPFSSRFHPAFIPFSSRFPLFLSHFPFFPLSFRFLRYSSRVYGRIGLWIRNFSVSRLTRNFGRPRMASEILGFPFTRQSVIAVLRFKRRLSRQPADPISVACFKASTWRLWAGMK